MIGNKGVDPVVATVLLIAIAVIAAIGVWYWVGAFTGKPPTGPQQQVALSLESCNGSHVQVRNTGGTSATAPADIYNSSSGAQVGYLMINSTSGALASGTVTQVTICSTTACPLQKITGGFKILDADYPAYPFSC